MTTNYVVVGGIVFLGSQLAKVTHYTGIAIQIFVTAHVFVQCPATQSVRYFSLLLGSFIPYSEIGVWHARHVHDCIIDSLVCCMPSWNR